MPVEKSRSRRPRTRRQAIPNRVPNALPDRMVFEVGYADSKQITAGAGAANGNQYRLNSLFDPDLSGVGSQPILNDNLAQLYGRYRVLSTRYEVTWHNNNSVDALVSVTPKNDTTLTTTYSQHLANSIQPGCRSGYTFSNTPPVRLRGSVECYKLAGCQGLAEYRGDDQYHAQFGASPACSLTLELTCSSPAAAGATQNIYILKMWYMVEVFDRIQQNLN